MKTLFLDADVVLDVLLDRAPGAEPAAALWAAVETRKARAILTAHAVTTIHALMKRSRGGAFADRGVSDLLTAFNVARVSEAVLKAALSLRLASFDDAVSAAAAAAARCNLLVARDPARFRGSPVEAVSPGEALARISSVSKAASPNRCRGVPCRRLRTSRARARRPPRSAGPG